MLPASGHEFVSGEQQLTTGCKLGLPSRDRPQTMPGLISTCQELFGTTDLYEVLAVQKGADGNASELRRSLCEFSDSSV